MGADSKTYAKLALILSLFIAQPVISKPWSWRGTNKTAHTAVQKAFYPLLWANDFIYGLAKELGCVTAVALLGAGIYYDQIPGLTLWNPSKGSDSKELQQVREELVRLRETVEYFSWKSELSEEELESVRQERGSLDLPAYFHLKIWSQRQHGFETPTH